MPDREKVIKAIICRRGAHTRCGNPCEWTGDCTYAAWIRDPSGEPYHPCYCDVERLCDDVLALLREQEKPGCERAEHDGIGCLGYAGCSQDDEPIVACKTCRKYTGNRYEEAIMDD